MYLEPFLIHNRNSRNELYNYINIPLYNPYKTHITMSETVLFKVSSEDKRALEREAKRNRMNVSAYIRQRLFVHNYISEVDEREY